jgi:PadR family transcriptional regulator PadR
LPRLTYISYGALVRITRHLVRVAMALMDQPRARHWGYELFKRSGVRPGALYPMLTRLLDEGWLADGWEDRAAIPEGETRPARRYYQLTDKGREELGAVVERARGEPRFAYLFAELSPGSGTGLPPGPEWGSTCGSFMRGWRRRWVIPFAGRWA